MWKDRVNIELTVAVLDSYKKEGCAIVDHHSLVRTVLKIVYNFQKFLMLTEQKQMI